MNVFVQPPEKQMLPSQDVWRQLREALLCLDVPAFEALIAELLQRLGYSETQIKRPAHCASTGKRRASRKGRNRHGGLDLQACNRSNITQALVLVQVKQYSRPVSRRFVDEIRGAMLRNGAQQGLLITTSTFSRTAHDAAAENPLMPITLLDGEQLLNLLFAQRLGVRHEQWNIDHGCFDRFMQHNEPDQDEPGREKRDD